MMKTTTLVLAVFSLALHCGCGSDNPRHADSDEIGDRVANHIVAAYGNNEIRLGMSMEELHKLDHPVEINSNPLRDIFQFKLNGIETRCEDNEVVAVHFYYRDREYQTYQGETREGIGVNSSIRDVICTYGEPDHVSNIRGQLARSQQVTLVCEYDVKWHSEDWSRWDTETSWLTYFRLTPYFSRAKILQYFDKLPTDRELEIINGSDSIELVTFSVPQSVDEAEFRRIRSGLDNKHVDISIY